MQTYTDQDLVKDLEDPGTADRAVDYLYRYSYPDIRSLVKRYRRPEEDAKDLFQDALMAFIDKVGYQGFDPDGTASAKTFLYLIAFRLWSKKLKRELKKETWEQHFAEDYLLTEDIVRRYEDKLTAIDLLESVGEKCRTLLREYYIEDIKVSELSKRYGIKESTLRQQLKRCLEKIKKTADKWNARKK